MKIEDVLSRTNKVLGWIGGFLIGALVVLIGVEVFFRYVIGSALSWPEEVAGFVFVWVTMIGSVLCMRDDSHAAITVVLNRFSLSIRKFVKAAIYTIILGYGCLMVVEGSKIMVLFGFEKSPAAGINLVWENASIPVAGIFIVLYAFFKIIDVVRS